jgi:hypothetical protein
MILIGWVVIAYGFCLLRKLAKASAPIDFLAALKGAALVVVAFTAMVSLGLLSG